MFILQNCYSIGCPVENCWKLLDYSPAEQVNRNLTIMGIIIGIMVVMVIASTVTFARAHYAKYAIPQPEPQVNLNCRELEAANLDTPTHEKEDTPPLPQRPQHTLKNVEDDGYVRGNDIQTWVFQKMRNANAFVGDARMSMCEKDC
ncbi:hypothetical protein GWK47_027779 [Chionoecetes opilio]|uniref:Uncharacterized protein n=1 Tax=Chionoecetes opilio TaxID=41210 RepID=A0A8J8WML1_CHIOP|nr:hypothetical protein GWK47_027779 [Chionoecetes opilio]